MPTDTYRVLITDGVHPVAAEIFENQGVEVEEYRSLTPEELAEMIGDYDALVVRSSKVEEKAIFENGQKLKTIGRAGTGFDNIDLGKATDRGIVVMTSPEANVPSTTQLTIGHMLNLARQIPIANENLHEKIWDQSIHKNDIQLTEKTLAIIGFGRIGSNVAIVAKALGMNVKFYDPDFRLEIQNKVKGWGFRQVFSHQELLEDADFVTLHAELNDDTRQIINAETLAMCRKGFRLINCARGDMVDPKAVYQALVSGHMAAAAFDVLPNEPKKKDLESWKNNPLLSLKNVFFTPHLGGTTVESQRNGGTQIAEQIVNYLLYGTFMNAVNEPYKKQCRDEIEAALKPHIPVNGAGRHASSLQFG